MSTLGKECIPVLQTYQEAGEQQILKAFFG